MPHIVGVVCNDGAFVMSGGPMPMTLSVDAIDGALQRALAVPESERTEVWHAMVDELLEQRIRADLATQGRLT